MNSANVTKRDQYGAIVLSSLLPATRKIALNLFEHAKNSKKIDEHGNWEFGAEFDTKGRGYAINWDLYATGKDYFTKRPLIVIQIRKYEKRYKNGFANITKSYFLIGKNEDNSTFAHPINANVIHNAIRKNEDVVRACQNWIFGTDYTKVVRQGDICLIPVRKPAKAIQISNHLILQDSHQLFAKNICKLNDKLYAENPEIWHLGGVHPVHYEEGWFKVVVGKRGNFHDFAAPTID